SVSFAPDGHSVLLAGLLVISGTGAFQYDIDTGRLTLHLSPEGGISHAAYSPDGRYIVTNMDIFATPEVKLTLHSARLWDARTGQFVRDFTHSVHVEAVAFSPNGKWLATGDLSGYTRVWNVETGELLQDFYFDFERISSVAFSPDGKYLLTG